MSVESYQPYVVSADSKLLLQRWGKETGHTVPDSSYLDAMTDDLQSVLNIAFGDSGAEIVKETEIVEGLENLANNSPYPIISMDRVYVNGNTPKILGHLDVTRAVNEKYEPLGLRERPGYANMEFQINEFASQEVAPVTILDDVIFGGKDLVETIIPALEKVNRPVGLVICGVGINEGVDRLREYGVEVQSVREYPDGVVDEICQRDFTASIPMSGRTIYDDNNNTWSAPYFKPFGDIAGWATIPEEHADMFSEFCLMQSIRLWNRIEKLSQKTVLTEETPRRIKSLRTGISIVKALFEHVDSIGQLS